MKEKKVRRGEEGGNEPAGGAAARDDKVGKLDGRVRSSGSYVEGRGRGEANKGGEDSGIHHFRFGCGES